MPMARFLVSTERVTFQTGLGTRKSFTLALVTQVSRCGTLRTPGLASEFVGTRCGNGLSPFLSSISWYAVPTVMLSVVSEAARAMVLAGAEILCACAPFLYTEWLCARIVRAHLGFPVYPTAIGSEPHDATISSKDHWTRVMQGHAGVRVCG
jgi:hypothetical protein